MANTVSGILLMAYSAWHTGEAKCLKISLFWLTVSVACVGPDLNLGESPFEARERGGAGALAATNAGSANGNAEAGAATATAPSGGTMSVGGSGLGGAGSMGNAGTTNTGGSGSAGVAQDGGATDNTVRPPFSVEAIPRPSFMALDATLTSLFVASDRGIWVGSGDIRQYFGSGLWSDFAEDLGGVIGDLWGDDRRPMVATAGTQVYFYESMQWVSRATISCSVGMALAVTPTFIYGACSQFTAGAVRIARDGSKQAELAPNLTNTSRSIWAFSDGDVYVLLNKPDPQGLAGSLVHYSGGPWNDAASWKQLSTATNAFFESMWSPDSASLVLVGSAGTIVRFRNGTWSNEESGTREDLYSVWGSVEDGLYAVGAHGTILFNDGTQWRPVASGTQAKLNVVRGRINGDIVAVGDSATILRIVR